MLKKLLILAALLLFTLISFGQSVFIARKTEVYRWNEEEWIYKSGNKRVKIQINMFKRLVHVDAKRPAYFYLSENSEKISGEGFVGFRYQAYDCSLDANCYIDLISTTHSGNILSIVWADLGQNIRYILNNPNTDEK